MTDLATMRTAIADEITRSDLNGLITRAINSAIGLWEGHRFPDINEKRFRINTVASQEYYDLAAPTLLLHDGSALVAGEKVIELDSITITVNQAPYPLTARTQQWMDQYQSLATQYTGQPDSYGLYGTQIRLYPIPDGVYPIAISALARLGPTPLVADADTNAWMTEGEVLIREQAKVIVGRFPLRDAELVRDAQSAADVAYQSLSRKSTAKAMTGTIRPWSL